MVKVKICGIRTVDALEAAVEAGADYVGFNFFPRSPRYIDPHAAQDLVDRLPDSVTPVGVFVGLRADEVETIAHDSGIRIAQLHGESVRPEIYRDLTLPVIVAIRVDNEHALEQMAFHNPEAFLLDAYRPGLEGGTGETFDWNIAHKAATRHRIFLAGGLTKDNVGLAVRFVKPFAVDVASGVESSPGVKDTVKIKQFIAAVRAAENIEES